MQRRSNANVHRLQATRCRRVILRRGCGPRKDCRGTRGDPRSRDAAPAIADPGGDPMTTGAERASFDLAAHLETGRYGPNPWWLWICGGTSVQAAPRLAGQPTSVQRRSLADAPTASGADGGADALAHGTVHRPGAVIPRPLLCPPGNTQTRSSCAPPPRAQRLRGAAIRCVAPVLHREATVPCRGAERALCATACRPLPSPFSRCSRSFRDAGASDREGVDRS
jgi:hypothetical protein